MPPYWPSTTLIMPSHKQTNTDLRRWSCRSDREAKWSEIGILGHRNPEGRMTSTCMNILGDVRHRRRRNAESDWKSFDDGVVRDIMHDAFSLPSLDQGPEGR